MSVLDELKSMQVELERLDAEIIAIDDRKKEVKKLRDDLKSKIDLATRVGEEYEEKAQEKAMYDSEAFATLALKIIAKYGSEFNDDIKQFAEAAILELPDGLKSEAEEEEIKEAS